MFLGPRMNYGLHQKATTEAVPEATTEENEPSLEPPAKRSKHKRFD